MGIIYLFLGPVGNCICGNQHYCTEGYLFFSSFDVAANSKTLIYLTIDFSKILMDLTFFCDYPNVFISVEKGISSDQDEICAHLLWTVGVFEASDFRMSRE